MNNILIRNFININFTLRISRKFTFKLYTGFIRIFFSKPFASNFCAKFSTVPVIGMPLKVRCLLEVCATTNIKEKIKATIVRSLFIVFLVLKLAFYHVYCKDTITKKDKQKKIRFFILQT